MRKGSFIGTLVVLAILGIALLILSKYIPSERQQAAVADYKSATFVIDGTPVTLANGVSEVEAAPGSASKIVTKYFGNLARGDIDGDSIPDLVFLLTRDTPGTGTFYYLVAAIQTTEGRYIGTNAIFLGDRIAPQTTEIQDGVILANYADRKPSEPMTAQPSVGVTKHIYYQNGALINIESRDKPPK